MFGRKREHYDFQAEVEAHIHLEADRLRQRGMSEEEALATARRTFGNRTAAQERFHETRRWMWWDNLKQDLRLAIRLLVKTPGWTAVATLTIALGIGASLAVFGVAYAMLMRPLPFPQPDQLYFVTELLGVQKQGTAVAGDYFTLRESMRGIADLAAFDSSSVSWSGLGRAKQLSAAQVTSSFFSVLQAQPLLGRTFRPGEDRPGADSAVILSYALWQREFGGDQSLVGQTVRLDRQPVHVIGIMPRNFAFPRGTDLWMPLVINEAEQRQRNRMLIVQMIARSNLGLDQTDAELARLTPIVYNEYPTQLHTSAFVEGLRIYADPLQARLMGDYRQPLLVFSGAVALMLLIVCFNVANLMLARATVRRREIAVRAALGAPRRRIVSQLFTESLLISFLGGAAGLGLAALAIAALNAAIATQPSGLPEISVNPLSAGLAVVLAMLTGLIAGAAPAFGSQGFSVQEALQRETRSATGSPALRWMRQALVVAQLALSLTLLIGAGLLVKSFVRLRNTDPGFRPSEVLTARIALADTAYPTSLQQREFIDRVLTQVKMLPGVESAAVLAGLNNTTVQIEHRPLLPPGQGPRANVTGVTRDYFQALGLRVLKGRLFSSADAADRPGVVVVNDSFARTVFPGEDPLGRRFAIGRAAVPQWMEIIGIVGDARDAAMDREPSPTVYASLDQQQNPFLTRMMLLLHSNGDSTRLTPAIEKVVAAIDSDQPVYDVKTMEQRLSDSLGSRRFNAALVGAFALMAAFLAAIGVYGVMSYLVTLRSQEMGIRLALGARPPQIERLVLREGVVLGLAGATLGIAGAVGLSRFLKALLYGVNTLDPATFTVVTVGLLGTVLVACYLPGRRAAHTDPLVALRHE